MRKIFSMVSGKRNLITLGYALAIGLMAAVSQIGTPKPLLIFLAVALSLPLGIVSLFGLYILSGLFNWVAAGFTTSSHGSGGGGCDTAGHCFSWGTQTGYGAHGFFFVSCLAVLFAGIAIGNSVIVRSYVAKKRTN